MKAHCPWLVLVYKKSANTLTHFLGRHSYCCRQQVPNDKPFAGAPLIIVGSKSSIEVKIYIIACIVFCMLPWSFSSWTCWLISPSLTRCNYSKSQSVHMPPCPEYVYLPSYNQLRFLKASGRRHDLDPKLFQRQVACKSNRIIMTKWGKKERRVWLNSDWRRSCLRKSIPVKALKTHLRNSPSSLQGKFGSYNP